MNDDLIYARVVNTVHINGQDVEYEAVSEEIPLPDENGGTDATLFMTSYLRLNAEKTGRPILFAFNGGPGSASVFLHLGGLGPQIIDLGDGISAPFDPPFRMKENAACILDICDMVFMDPVGCGYSRALTGDAVKKYASSQEDAKAMLLGIDRFLSRHKRWNCPVFILGESYGTVRAALMAQQLYENMLGNTCNALNIHAAGLILVGSLLDRDKSLFPVERTVTNFPAIAAAHWYHTQGEKPALKEVMAEAEDFALRYYLPVLGLGKKATEEEREGVIESLVHFSGLPRGYFERHGLRLSVEDYVREVVNEKGLLISQYDSRFVSHPLQAGGQYHYESDDACFERLMPAFTHCYYGVMKDALGITTDRDYQFTGLQMCRAWEFDAPRNPIHFVEDAMRKNQDMKVLFANGYYDMLTTYSYSEYMINNFDLPTERVRHTGYEGGHMAYIGEAQCAKFGDDLRRFVKWATKKQ